MLKAAIKLFNKLFKEQMQEVAITPMSEHYLGQFGKQYGCDANVTTEHRTVGLLFQSVASLCQIYSLFWAYASHQTKKF